MNPKRGTSIEEGRKQGKQSSFLFGGQDHMPHCTGIFVLNVQYIVYTAVVLFPFTFVGGGGDALCVDLYFKFKDSFNYFIYYLIC